MKTSAINLAIGQTWEAWRKYPHVRNQIRAHAVGPPILITGAYRSGTTWLGKLLSGQGIWALHEPFNPNKGIWKETLSYASPNACSIDSIDNYIGCLLEGKITIGSVKGQPVLNNIACNRLMMPARLGFYPKPPNRVLIKDPMAALLSGYLTNRFGFKTLVIMRHPCGFVSSLYRLNWEEYVRRELDQICRIPETLAHFSMRQMRLIEKRNSFDALKIYSLMHAVLNKILLGVSSSVEGMSLVSYESLCLKPEIEIDRCYGFAELELRNEDRCRHASLMTANSVNEESNPYSTFRNSEEMAEVWKRRLTQKQVDEVRALWTEFEIDHYTEERHWRRNGD